MEQKTFTAEDFKLLYEVNCNDKTEKKNGLTYLSWAWAWAEFKKRFPTATYEIKKFDGLPYLVDSATGIIVYTSVTVNDLTHEMWLPVMDGANKAMKLEQYQYQVWNRYKNQWETKTVEAATMFDINKTIMRCLTKNLAMFGLGLYIYAGEDLPETIDIDAPAAEAAAPAPTEPKPATTTRKPRQKKTDDLPPDNAPAPAAEAAAPAAQQKREVKHIAMSDTNALQQIIDWTMRQPNTEAAIQKISIGYDWEQTALDYVVAQVKERFAFINDLHGQN